MIARRSVPAEASPTISPPKRIRRPVMVQRWSNLSFLHWPYEPGVVQRLLPEGLEVDVAEGAAWIGLIPFRLTVRLHGTPPLPWIASCGEINVRTYVRGPDGRQGIWFISLDASRLTAVAMARGWYYLPYMWARVRVQGSPHSVRYAGKRRWPSPHRPRFDIEVAPSGPIRPNEMTFLERFLISRWRLYSPFPSGLAATQVEHAPWPLWAARVLNVRQDLLRAAGLPGPGADPIAHFSPGVVTRFGRRHPV